jgi:hypothetical protein
VEIRCFAGFFWTITVAADGLPHSETLVNTLTLCVKTDRRPFVETCGSGLARDSGGSANINFDCAAVIAGKPAPTGFVVYERLSRLAPAGVGDYDGGITNLP